MSSEFTRPVAMAPWWPAIALLAIGSLAFLHLLAIPVFEDEGSQIRWIVRIIEAGEWLGPMGDGKPLEAWPMVPWVALGMPAILVMRAMHVLAGAIGAVLVYRIALRVLDWRPAFVSGILFAICPFVVYLQRFALSDTFVCLAALTVCLSLLKFTERLRWRDAAWLATGLVFGALSKLPVGFVLMIAAPLALILMPAASRQRVLRAPVRTRLLAAQVPALSLAVLIAVIALVRVRRGLAPGFGLSDFLGVGLGRYHGIGEAMGAARLTLAGELAAQLSWPVMLIGAAGIAAGTYFSDWRLRWLAASAAVPMLAIATLASFWFSRYLLFTLPPLIIVAVAGWCALAARAASSSHRLVRSLAQPALAALCIACVLLMGRQSALIVLEPAAASWSPVDRFQYFEGWSSGYGYPEAAALLLAAPPAASAPSAPSVPAHVFALDGHSAYQLRSYLPRAWSSRINSIDYGPDGRALRTAPERLENLLRSNSTWIIIPEPLLQRYLDASFGESHHPDLRLIATFDKPGARTRLAIYEASGGAAKEPSYE
jgi:4-amino-4-deoxy-L-arabinose transferase-like glycosyltransferase